MKTISDCNNKSSTTMVLDTGFATERDSRELTMGAVERSEFRRNSNLYTHKYLNSFAETIFKINGHTVCICDTDMFLMEISDIKTYIGKHITNVLFYELEKNKSIYINNTRDEKKFIALTNDENYSEFCEQYIQPISKDDTVIGAIIILTKNSERYDNKHIDDTEIRTAKEQAVKLASITKLI